MRQMGRLENKVALVTGASSGMGYEIAKLFAKEGASVVAIARRKEKLADLVAKIEADGGKAIAVAGDVTSEEDVPVSYTHLRAHETRHDLVCRLLLEKKKKKTNLYIYTE